MSTPSRTKAFLTALLLILIALGVYVLIVYRAVRAQSWSDETRPAASIVVFGAAEYAGKPSPVFRARLDHAFNLYQRQVAPFVIVTGGTAGDKTSEGAVGHDYLVRLGIPESAVIAETQGGDTAESAKRVARIMHRNGMKDCVAVSDDYHIFRIKQMLAAEGIVAYGAPRPQTRPITRGERVRRVLREVASYTAWRMGL